MSTYAGHRVLTANLIKIVIFILFYNNTPSCCLLDSWLLQIHYGSRDLTTLVRAAGSNVWISKSMPQLFIKAFNVSLFHLFFFRSTASLLAWINLVIEYFLWKLLICGKAGNEQFISAVNLHSTQSPSLHTWIIPSALQSPTPIGNKNLWKNLVFKCSKFHPKQSAHPQTDIKCA